MVTLSLPSRAADEGGLVDQVGQVGAGEPGRRAGDDLEIDVLGQRNPLDVDLENVLAALGVGHGDDDPAVEPPGTEQGGVQDVRPVRGRDQDDPLVRVESVHLDEELVERLLALVVPSAEAGSALAADGVDLVDEDQAGGVLLALVEQVPDPRGADPDEHLHEIRAADREEGDIGFAGDGPGEEGLPGPGSPYEQNALGDASAELLELLGVLEELDDLIELFFGFLDAGHVLERHLLGQSREQLGPALAERHRLVPAGLHLPHEKDPEEDEEDDREPADEERQPAAAGGVLDDDGHLVLAKDLDQLIVLGREDRLEGSSFPGLPPEIVVADGDFLDVPLFDLVHELGEGDLFPGGVGVLEDAPEENDEDPR